MIIKLFNSFVFRSRHYSSIFDHGKELVRFIKNIEKKIFNKNNISRHLKKKNFYEKYSCNSDFKKIINLNKNFYLPPIKQIIHFKKLSEKILNLVICARGGKKILDMYSKFLKFNLYLCTKKKISGFLIHHKLLKYSKFVLNKNFPISPKVKDTLWNMINYFNYFQIY
jgi:hypothetical protein